METTREPSHAETREAILGLKGELEARGFTTSWSRPFMEWVHPDRRSEGKPEPEGATEFYVSGFPVKKAAPFDFVEARISASGTGLIYFSLTFTFFHAFDDCLEPEEFIEVMKYHDDGWFSLLSLEFGHIEERFRLQWGTEYDDVIEDYLWGNYRFDEKDTIIGIMEAVRWTGVGSGFPGVTEG